MLIKDFHYTPCEACGVDEKAVYLAEVYLRNEEDTGRDLKHLCAACYMTQTSSGKLCQSCSTYLRETSYRSMASSCKACKDNFLNEPTIRSCRSNPLNLVDKLPDQLLTGIELEIEVSGYLNYTRKANEVLDLIGKDFAITKEDGSVGGFELVTIPAILSQHKKRFEWLKDKRPEKLIGWSGRNNGLHIHMSRKYISPITLVKLLQFVYSKYNRQFMYAVAGRKNDEYASLSIFDHGSQKLDRWLRKEKWDSNKKTIENNLWVADNDRRYVGVNLLNKHTIEFRIFRATLNYDRLISNLEFLYALVNWLHQQKLTEELKWEDFVKWAETSHYKYLKKFFKEKKHLSLDYKIDSNRDDDYDDDYDGDDDRGSWCEGCQDYH